MDDYLMPCDECGEVTTRRNMIRTTDYHGLPFRLVCSKCYKSVMKKGYDGDEYEYDNDDPFDDCILDNYEY